MGMAAVMEMDDGLGFLDAQLRMGSPLLRMGYRPFYEVGLC